jgi:hypothetical protein
MSPEYFQSYPCVICRTQALGMAEALEGHCSQRAVKAFEGVVVIWQCAACEHNVELRLDAVPSKRS